MNSNPATCCWLKDDQESVTSSRSSPKARGLTPRQEELLDAYGYPYVFDQFRFHMTLTDRLSEAEHDDVLQAAQTWFGPILNDPVTLDRLTLFHEKENKLPFNRIAEFGLGG